MIKQDITKTKDYRTENILPEKKKDTLRFYINQVSRVNESYNVRAQKTVQTHNPRYSK